MPASRKRPSASRSTSATMRAVIEFCRRKRSISSWSARKRRCSPASSKSGSRRHQGVRPTRPRRGSKAQRLHQGSLPGQRHSDRGLRALQCRRSGQGYVRAKGAPVVVKADGLAAGKGVVVAADARRSRSRHRHDVRRRAGPGRHRNRGRGILARRRSLVLRLCDGETAMRARRRRRTTSAFSTATGPEYRRHGRLFARAERR